MINQEVEDKTQTGDEALLQEIRDRYEYAWLFWQDIFDERRIDLRYVGGDPWDEKDRRAREDAKRPCISHDELNQYLNQAINNLRQNKRGIKIDPDGNGADEHTAELEQDIIRTIEYRSNAQSAYVTAYQAQLEGSIGYFRIGRRYVENENLTAENFDHQEMAVRNIANPESVLYDPDCKEADWSDAEFCFVLNPISREEFKRKYPKAQIKDFSSEHARVARDWILDRMVLTAEYWKVTTTVTKVYLLESGAIVDKLPKGVTAVSERTKKVRRITQYITNGVEILSSTPEPGTIIPIVPVIGLMRYIDDGGGSRLKIGSLVRLARDPQMTLAYLASGEMEEAGLTPKAPYMGYVGQFETDSEAWEHITKIPRSMIQVDPIPDGSSGQVLPLPTRVQFTPNFQQYEVAKDSARRAIQSAMGISALPTAAQRNNEKSGVALDKIKTAQDVGSFHFLDNFDRSLMLAGRIMDERMEVVYGQPDREMYLRKADDTHRNVKLNTEEPYFDEKDQKNLHFVVGKGRHNITISVGPWQQSQRDAQSDFVDTLIQNIHQLPIAPPQAAKILSIAIQMKQLGPLGDKLAQIISPDEQQQMPPEAQAALAKQGQLLQELQGELQKLLAEKAGKVVDNEYKLQLEHMKIEADVAKAEIMTKAQSIEERMAFVEDLIQQLHGQAHDAALQAQDQAHQAQQATQQQQAAAEQQEAAAQQQPEPQAA